MSSDYSYRRITHEFYPSFMMGGRRIHVYKKKFTKKNIRQIRTALERILEDLWDTRCGAIYVDSCVSKGLGEGDPGWDGTEDESGLDVHAIAMSPAEPDGRRDRGAIWYRATFDGMNLVSCGRCGDD